MSKEPIDRATPTIPGPDETVPQKIALVRRLVPAMEKSEDWPDALDVQKAAADWTAENEALAANQDLIRDLLIQLHSARTSQGPILRRWLAKKHALVAAVDTYCDGSKDKVASLCCDVATRTARPLATVPEGLHGVRSKVVGRATAQWTTHRGEHNTFVVQYAANRDDPSTYSPTLTWTKGTFTLDGQTPGAMLDFRVAAVDARLPGGQTAWTSWVAVRVSA
jgi:hypothetical protein